MWPLPDPFRASPEAIRLADELEANAAFFDPAVALLMSRAPGRLDIMGGFADYSGGLVLEMPIARATFALLQADDAPCVRIRSAAINDAGHPAEVALSLDELQPDGKPLTYENARTRFAAHEHEHWAAYVIGTLLVLLRERGITLDHGLRILVLSDVPIGKGVSSSAALEVAAMRVLCAHFGIGVNGRDLALLCQMAENLVVGAPCGVMDQMTATFGERGKLVALLCQPAEVQGNVPIPDNVGLWAVDSGIRHAISGADYSSVRIGTYMGYRMIAEIAGLDVEHAQDGRIHVQDPHWHGYLVNISPSEYEAQFRAHLPDTLSGREFLARYHGTTDHVTRVDPSRIYAVRRPVEHPIYEQHRVQLVRALLRNTPPCQEALCLIGEMMYQAHESYNACNIGSDATDRLVALAREAGPAQGIYGAKITGGGSGGFVAMLARADAGSAVDEIARRYRSESGKGGDVLQGTSDGALAFGVIQIIP